MKITKTQLKQIIKEEIEELSTDTAPEIVEEEQLNEIAPLLAALPALLPKLAPMLLQFIAKNPQMVTMLGDMVAKSMGGGATGGTAAAAPAGAAGTAE